jgi:hypothetical protein
VEPLVLGCGKLVSISHGRGLLRGSGMDAGGCRSEAGALRTPAKLNQATPRQCTMGVRRRSYIINHSEATQARRRKRQWQGKAIQLSWPGRNRERGGKDEACPGSSERGYLEHILEATLWGRGGGGA